MHSFLLSTALLSVVGSSQPSFFTLPMQEVAFEEGLPTQERLESGQWHQSGHRELLMPYEERQLIFDLSHLSLDKHQAWAIRLQHRHLGFELYGFHEESAEWQLLDIRAELPLGVVLSAEHIRPYRYLGLRFSGTILGVVQMERMTQLETIGHVNTSGTQQLLLFGMYAFLVIASMLLLVFFGRKVYVWYFLYLLGGSLAGWVASPGNPTIPLWITHQVPVSQLGVICSSLGFVGILVSMALQSAQPSFLEKTRTAALILGCVGAISLPVAPQLSELLGLLVLSLATLLLGPYILLRGFVQRMNQKIWLVGVMGANLLGFVSSFLQVSGDGLSVQASTIGLASIVVLHFVLLGFFVFEDFAEQRREVLGLKRLVAAEAKQLHERQVAIAVVSSQLDRERATQRRLVSERDEAQARLETVTKNLRGAFEQMIETKRFATLGGFWPQFSGALSSGMDRLIHLRRELAPSLERLDQLELVEKMDTALSSCREMADAVEGALEFDGKRSAELDRVVPMAVTLLGWSSDEPTLQIRMEKGLEVPGAQAEWLQLVMNLLANARDAIGGDEGQNAGARVVFQASRLEMGVQIVVEDSGPGWPAELLRVRLTDLLEEPQQRTGLGLAICAAICKRYEATMTLHKSALGGASVTIQAPLPGET